MPWNKESGIPQISIYVYLIGWKRCINSRFIRKVGRLLNLEPAEIQAKTVRGIPSIFA